MLELADVFHTGMLVSDLHAGMREVGAALGVAWTAVGDRELPVRGRDGTTTVRLRFVYSRQGPHRIELIEVAPGSLWDPADVDAPSGAHHLGVWCDDLVAGARALEAQGGRFVATLDVPGREFTAFTYHRMPSGELIELVDRRQTDVFAAWFAGGAAP